MVSKEKLNRLAKIRYGRPFDDLCSRRQKIIRQVSVYSSLVDKEVKNAIS